MTYGAGPWGRTPWGGGAPSVGGAVQVLGVRYITPNLIRLNLSTVVVVNSHYSSTSNYNIALRSDSPVAGDSVSVNNVLLPQDGSLVVDYVYLETSGHTAGATYTVSVTELDTVDGAAGLSIVPMSYTARRTKTIQMLKSLPSHFDTSNTSLIASVLAAISIQDDIIGGSLSDEFPKGT